MSKKRYSSSKIIEMLTEIFERFPGIGKKTANRFAYHLIQKDVKTMEKFIEIFELIKDNIKECSLCHNISETNPCHICSDKHRDGSIICVVETIKDINSIERSGKFRGRFHVLKGVISPIMGIHPKDLTIADLTARVKKNPEIKEIIIATSPTTEGEVTANYIKKVFSGSEIKLTRIAYGVPVGSELENIDEVTLFKAFEGRKEF
ncbi:MAG: recombination mediator RecR [bacterium]|nr:recombination mediator RecR [bacterium]